MKTYFIILLLAFSFHSCSLNAVKSEDEINAKWEQMKKGIPDALIKPYLESGIYFVNTEGNTKSIVKRTSQDSTVSKFINPNPIVTSAELNDVQIINGPRLYHVNLYYKGNGPKAICNATSKLAAEEGSIAFIVDNVLVSVPGLYNGPICGGSLSIAGFADIEMATAIQEILRKEMKGNQ